MRTSLKLLFLGILLVVAAASVRAETSVLFGDGRTLRVDGVERIDDRAILTLRRGGQIAVPADRVANWDELDRAPRPKPGRHTAKRTWPSGAAAYAGLIAITSERHGIEARLLAAMIEVGSAFDPTAVSPTGACGLMQLTPEDAERLGVADPFDPVQNLEGGARHLRSLLDRYNGRTDLALAGYRSGVEAVNRHRGVPPYRSTRRYVSLVLEKAETGQE